MGDLIWGLDGEVSWVRVFVHQVIDGGELVDG